MWSVVIESPKIAKALAPTMSLIGSGSFLIFSKYGGF